MPRPAEDGASKLSDLRFCLLLIPAPRATQSIGAAVGMVGWLAGASWQAIQTVGAPRIATPRGVTGGRPMPAMPAVLCCAVLCLQQRAVLHLQLLCACSRVMCLPTCLPACLPALLAAFTVRRCFCF